MSNPTHSPPSSPKTSLLNRLVIHLYRAADHDQRTFSTGFISLEYSTNITLSPPPSPPNNPPPSPPSSPPSSPSTCPPPSPKITPKISPPTSVLTNAIIIP